MNRYLMNSLAHSSAIFAGADVETALAVSRENLRLVENHRPARQASLCK